MLDPLQAPAQGLVGLYHERWEIETAYCELKSRILGGRVLRGRHPAAVLQEVWALLTCYQVLRTAMTDTTLQHPGTDPDRLSFSIGLRTARDLVIQARPPDTHPAPGDQTRDLQVPRQGTTLTTKILTLDPGP